MRFRNGISSMNRAFNPLMFKRLFLKADSINTVCRLVSAFSFDLSEGIPQYTILQENVLSFRTETIGHKTGHFFGTELN